MANLQQADKAAGPLFAYSAARDAKPQIELKTETSADVPVQGSRRPELKGAAAPTPSNKQKKPNKPASRGATRDEYERLIAGVTADAEPPRIAYDDKRHLTWSERDKIKLPLCLGLMGHASRTQIRETLRDVERSSALYGDGSVCDLEDCFNDPNIASLWKIRAEIVNAILADLWRDPPKSRAAFQARLLTNDLLALARNMTAAAYRDVDLLRACPERAGAVQAAARAAGTALAAQAAMKSQPVQAINVEGHAIVQTRFEQTS